MKLLEQKRMLLWTLHLPSKDWLRQGDYHSWEILYVDESVCNGKDEDIWEDMILAK